MGLSFFLSITGSLIFATDVPSSDKSKTPAAETAMGKPAAAPQAQSSSPKSSRKPKYRPFSEVIGETPAIEGMIKLYRKETKLYAEITPGVLNRDLMLVLAIARGIGERPILGGMTWGTGDEWIMQFRKADDRIQLVRRNVRFRAKKGSPLEKAVYFAYTDSILFSLPIQSVSPSGGAIVDLTPVFFSDLPQISTVGRNFRFDANRSTWASVKGYKDNVEIEVAATYAASGRMETVADTRGITINVHYSLSRLPVTGYQPRLADDRIGYFITALKDYSKHGETDPWVRYVNRWDLQKADPSLAVSPPKHPIIFWIEKTVPYAYRAPIRAGILEWNNAFEKAGFSNAIEVRQQPDDAAWEPEDINYNTFRWITSSVGFAMGPSRVNPLNGQILDADVIFDADFVEIWHRKFEVTPPVPRLVPAMPGDWEEYVARMAEQASGSGRHGYLCEYASGLAQQLGIGAVALAKQGKPISKTVLDKLIIEGVQSIATHEVGHTLGLRHNFKASTWLTLEDLDNLEKTRQSGLAASVMDYLPLNVAPKGQKQGQYFSLPLGPYDYWAIEYGYKPFPGGTDGEKKALAKIASRGAEPGLDYATDDDCRSTDSDPLVNRFDLGKDPIQFARRRAELFHQVIPGLVDAVVKPGEGYQTARTAFGLLMNDFNNGLHFAARFIGGIYVHRDHKGDPKARPPFVPVEPAKQRDALALLEQQAFGLESYRFPPNLVDYLADEHWSQWGMTVPDRQELALQELTLGWQDKLLRELLEPLTLSRIAEAETKTPPPDQEPFTNAELLRRLTGVIFQETEKLDEGKFTIAKPAISPVRRNLQCRYFEHLADLAMGESVSRPAPKLPRGHIMIVLGNSPGDTPSVVQSVAAAELEFLQARLKKVLEGKAELDDYTRVHLKELSARIQKVLEARLSLSKP
ncbi:MAG: zinc-dependent metalloprotease [Pirellulales bacterium]|nr:zinc-dependent metalloprotease [Pirellulales bacterium]